MMIGTELPVGTACGICTFTCKTPATSPGAPPAYCTGADRPPTIAITGSATGKGAGQSPGFPSTPSGFVCPSPVAYTEMYEPTGAGLLDEFTVPSWLIIAPSPRPDASLVKMRGPAVDTGIETMLEL